MAPPHLSVSLPEGPGLPEVEDFIAAVRKSYPSPENPRDVRAVLKLWLKMVNIINIYIIIWLTISDD